MDKVIIKKPDQIEENKEDLNRKELGILDEYENIPTALQEEPRPEECIQKSIEQIKENILKKRLLDMLEGNND